MWKYLRKSSAILEIFWTFFLSWNQTQLSVEGRTCSLPKLLRMTDSIKELTENLQLTRNRNKWGNANIQYVYLSSLPPPLHLCLLSFLLLCLFGSHGTQFKFFNTLCLHAVYIRCSWVAKASGVTGLSAWFMSTSNRVWARQARLTALLH